MLLSILCCLIQCNNESALHTVTVGCCIMEHNSNLGGLLPKEDPLVTHEDWWIRQTACENGEKCCTHWSSSASKMMSKIKNPRFAWMVFNNNCTWTSYRCTAVQCCWRYNPHHHQSRDQGSQHIRWSYWPLRTSSLLESWIAKGLSRKQSAPRKVQTTSVIQGTFSLHS